MNEQLIFYDNNASIIYNGIQHYLSGIIEDANRNNIFSNYVFHHLYGTKDK